MEVLTLTEQYYICAANRAGKFSGMTSYGPAGAVAAGIMDLALSGMIKISRTHAETTEENPQLPEYLSLLYQDIKKARSGNLKKVMETYVMALTDKKYRAYLNALLAELERKGAAHREKISGFFGEKTQVAIDATVRARLMERLCAAFDGERPADEIGEDVMLLALFLKKTGVLKGRVDAETYRKIAVKLREGRKLPKNKAAFELIDYVEEIWLLLMTAAT